MRCVNTDKVAAPLAKLEAVVLTGFSNKIQVVWNTDTSYPEQTVTMIWRRADNTDEFSLEASTPRDSGTLSTALTLETSTLYTLWLRPENPLNYGEWQSFSGIADDGWISGVEAVIFGDDVIYHGNDLVVIPTIT